MCIFSTAGCEIEIIASTERVIENRIYSYKTGILSILREESTSNATSILGYINTKSHIRNHIQGTRYKRLHNEAMIKVCHKRKNQLQLTSILSSKCHIATIGKSVIFEMQVIKYIVFFV